MSKKKIFFLYSLFIILIAAFFLYSLFPSEIVEDYIIFHLKKMNPAVTVSIDSIKPLLLPGLKFRGVTVNLQDNHLFEATYIKIRPGILSFFQKKNTFFINCKAYEGVFDGKVDVTGGESLSRIAIDADVSGIQLKEIEIIQNVTKYPISAILDGNVTYSNIDEKNIETGVAAILLSDCSIELKTPIFKQEHLTFKTIEAKLELNNRHLKFKQCELKGNQLEGSISGYILIKTPSGKSTLRLTGTLEPQPALLEDLGGAAQFLFDQRSGRSSISFRVDGMLDKPRFSLK